MLNVLVQHRRLARKPSLHERRVLGSAQSNDANPYLRHIVPRFSYSNFTKPRIEGLAEEELSMRKFNGNSSSKKPTGLAQYCLPAAHLLHQASVTWFA